MLHILVEVIQTLGWAIDIDGQHRAYVTGATYFADFPVTFGAFDTSFSGSSDIFVAKLNENGTGLVYSSLIGGSNDASSEERSYDIAVDNTGAAFIAGRSGASDYPTTNGAFDTNQGGGKDAVVTKLNASGGQLVYSTFLGGYDQDIAFGIAVSPSGLAYVVGATNSPDFPVTGGAYDGTLNGDYDGFMTVLNPTGTGLGYSSFIGGVVYDGVDAVAVSPDGSAVLVGGTNSTNFPTTSNAVDNTFNGRDDGFVAKLQHRWSISYLWYVSWRQQ